MLKRPHQRLRKENKMSTLVNVNEQAMPMGDNTGQAGDGQTGPKRHFKHIGELVDGGAKVVIMYRTVPGEADNCLVVGTKFLPDQYHNSLMKAVESEGGQDADEFADFASRQTFPDGTNMLAMLHNDNYIKKFKTKDSSTFPSDSPCRTSTILRGSFLVVLPYVYVGSPTKK